MENNRSTTSKRPKRRFLINYLKEFTANSNLHGLKYIGESSCTLLERIFWAVVFISSICMCVFLIKKLWTKWDQTPVIVSFGEKLIPVWQIPFPAITICSKNKVRESTFNYSQKHVEYETLNESEQYMVQDISLLCEDEVLGRKFGNSSTVKNMQFVAPPLDRIADYCNWRGNKVSCDEIFTRVLTYSGICYSFNTLAADEIFRSENIQRDFPYSEESQTSNGWSLENGYKRNASKDVYPRRGRKFGAAPDLIVQLTAHKSDKSDLCDGPISGLEVIIHNPAETSLMSPYNYEVKPGTQMDFALTVILVSTSPSLRNYHPISRQCYFPTERYLRYFKVYTQKNCELECQANFTHAKCNCVPFYLPYQNSHRICSTDSTPCVQESNEMLAEILITAEDDEIKHFTGQDQANKQNEDTLNSIARFCSCLPTCTIASYDAVTSDAKFNNIIDYAKAISTDDMNFTAQLAEIKISGINFYFKESQYISMRRSELYGQTDFLANCGGLLGLFLGFSALSLVEIFYFMTLRLCGAITKSRVSNLAAENMKQRLE